MNYFLNLFFIEQNRTRNAITKAVESKDSHNIIEECKEVLGAYLDKKHGASITDTKIFRQFAQYWEDAYFKDMDALNIIRPDVLTRVSEYVQEIIVSIEKIISNGFGYVLDGSVYFNTIKFDKTEGHSYAKLEPWSAGDVKKILEGEGELSSEGQKNHKADFVLWKKSKPGEPTWDSPWGKVLILVEIKSWISRVDQGGILSVQRWQVTCWAIIWIFILEELIWRFRIMTTSWHNQRLLSESFKTLTRVL